MDNRSNSGHSNSGDCNSGDCNSGNWNSGNCNSGRCNSGDYNSGNWNSGLFNRNSPKLRIFEKETDLTMTEFRKKYGYPEVYPILTEYKNNKLVTYEYKAAWQTMWNKATDKEKQWYLGLPNFHPQVFFDITGIDVREQKKKNSGSSLVGKIVTVTMAGKTYDVKVMNEK